MVLLGPPVLAAAALVAAVLLQAASSSAVAARWWRGGSAVAAPSWGPGFALLVGWEVYYARAMRYRVLGPLEVETDTGPVTLGGQKERLLRPSC